MLKKFAVGFIIALLSFSFIVWIQISLSKHKNKILGFVLPILSLVFITIPRVINILDFGMDMGEFFRIGLPSLLLANIPTIILFVIYIIYRKKAERDKELEKMNIQDLK